MPRNTDCSRGWIPDAYPSEADLEPCVHCYIPHEDPTLNPNPSVFILVPNPMDIDAPFLLDSHPTTTNPIITELTYLHRNLCGLPPQISEHASPFFPPSILDTPEFKAARKAYDTHHRCIDAKHAFLNAEESLLHETRIQYEMRKTGSCRSIAEGWSRWLEPRDPAIKAYKAGLDEEFDFDEALAKLQPHRKCARCRELDETADARAKILARDPWLAQENDKKFGVGNWVPEPGFGAGRHRSNELMRREGMIARAWEKMCRYDAKRWEMDKFVTPFPGDARNASRV